MKSAIKYLFVAAVSFVGGVITGYIFKKKTSEITFEEIPEEEQAALVAASEEKQEPINIQKAIDKTFNEEHYEKDIDTQKVQYFKKWKADEAATKYDTTTKEEPENAVVTTEEVTLDKETEQFLDDIGEVEENHPDVEPASIEDWEYWEKQQGNTFDAEYDCEEILYYRDNVITDESGNPISNPGKKLGFDVPYVFENIDDETTGDPNVRVVINHPNGVIYRIVHKNCDYVRGKLAEEYGSEYDDGENEPDE